MVVKKVSIIFILLFIWSPTVLARTADPKRLPKVEPLRPPGENINVNYQGTINYSADAALGQTGSSSPDSLETGNGEENILEAAEKAGGQTPGTSKAGSVWGWVLLLVVIGGAGGLIFKYRKP